MALWLLLDFILHHDGASSGKKKFGGYGTSLELELFKVYIAEYIEGARYLYMDGREACKGPATTNTEQNTADNEEGRVRLTSTVHAGTESYKALQVLRA